MSCHSKDFQPAPLTVTVPCVGVCVCVCTCVRALLTAWAGSRTVSCVCERALSAPSPSPAMLLFCQELQCFPEERKLFHFQLLSGPECERRSFSNIRSFQLPSPSEQKYTPPSWSNNSRWAQKNSDFLNWFNFPHQILDGRFYWPQRILILHFPSGLQDLASGITQRERERERERERGPDGSVPVCLAQPKRKPGTAQ